MNKREFKAVVKDGLTRGKLFMVVKIIAYKNNKDQLPISIVIPRELADKKALEYMRATDDNLVFNDTKDQLVDVLFTSNLDALNWFVY